MTYRLVVATGIVCASAVLIAWNIRPSTDIVFSEALPPSIEATDGLTVGWVGDMVPSTDTIYNANAFSQVSSYLIQPDLMIGNLEGTFASAERTSKCTYLLTQCHAFRGTTDFATSIKSAGFDLISLVNNHSYDFGDEGLAETESALSALDIPYISQRTPTTSITIDGKHIGVLGVSSTKPASTITDYAYITREIAKLKKENDYVVFIFHGGAEGADKTAVPGADEYQGDENRGNVELASRTAIDAGADLVLGSGPHVLRKIENYKNKTIAYSLGNFVSGGHLVTRGVLGLSGIFVANLDDNTHSFISTILSATGTPIIDTEERSQQLLNTLQ